MDRRGFLKSMLALAAAPAICKAENLMKIYVPPQEIYIPAPEILEVSDFTFGTGDFTVEAWLNNDQWRHFARVYNGGKVKEYIDGKLVPIGSQEKLIPGVKLVGTDLDRINNVVIVTPPEPGAKMQFTYPAGGGDFTGHMDELRLTQGVCRDPAKDFERFRGNYEAKNSRFPRNGFAINHQQPQRSKLLDWMINKEAPIMTLDGKKMA